MNNLGITLLVRTLAEEEVPQRHDRIVLFLNFFEYLEGQVPTREN